MMIIETLNRIENVQDITYRYFYRLVKSTVTMEMNGEELDIQSYGIEIERQDYKGNQLLNIEMDRINHVSPHRYKCYELLKVLYSQGVSPIHLIDILEQYLEDLVKEYDSSYTNIAMI